MIYTINKPSWHQNGDRTWFGKELKIWRDTPQEIRNKIPRFEKVPYEIKGEGENPDLDMIVRDRLVDRSDPLVPDKNMDQVRLLPDTDKVQIPITNVSKEYQLVQHYEVFDVLLSFLEKSGINMQHLKTELCLTKFGECMWLSFTLPDFHLDFGDKEPMLLTLNALNSVDRTTALEVYLFWYRLICANGLIYGDNIEFKEIHRTDRLDPDGVEKFLTDQLAPNQFEGQQQLLIQWFRRSVTHTQEQSDAKPTRGEVEYWLDKHVSKEWSVHAAARVYHIAKTGNDAKFVNNTGKDIKEVKYDELTLQPNTET